ncbi:hypothetical protein [Falcatimonas sp. MSJ-15]|nr:hypothetical protein [Falcatimonas sp. MSJ-15]
MACNGQKFDAYYSVIMPDTWTPVFDLTVMKQLLERSDWKTIM